VGRDYLEKLIQFPIRIPPLNTVELTNYVNLLFTQLHTKPEEFESSRQRLLADKKKKGFDFVFDINNVSDYFKQVPGELKELFQLSAQVVPILAVGLNGNPRQTKRFLNTLLIRHSMANSRGAVLDKRILAKMMLLEYFKPETFNSFYKQQAENNGQIQHIGDLERMAQDQQAAGGSPGATISPEMEAYLSDRWLKAWLQAAPTLQNIDLRPYYYVSRDKLAVKDLRLQRMSPDAQDFYSKLMSDSDAVSAPALQDAHRLNSGDAAAVFDAVCMKAREMGRQVGEKAPLRRLYQFCEKRPDLISQWIGFLDKFPDSDITPSAVIWLNTLTRGNAYRPAAKALVTKWAGNPVDGPLTKISKNKLSDFN
jgi:predicted KAP-like P-loop ATPase